VVNSQFTQQVFLRNFPIIAADPKKSEQETLTFGRKHCPEILYPPINLKVFEKSPKFSQTIDDLLARQINGRTTHILTSLNRYERKKNIPLALHSFAKFMELTQQQNGTSGEDQDCVLVVAGGWDQRVAENVEHLKELIKAAEELKILNKVVFLKSISNDQRLLLLEHTKVLLYTPENEHFGIVPVEAMHMGCLVMACDSGGPLESVANGETGYLQAPKPELWGARIFELLEKKDGGVDETKLENMRGAARKRVQDMFVMDVFANNLDRIVKRMV